MTCRDWQSISRKVFKDRMHKGLVTVSSVRKEDEDEEGGRASEAEDKIS